MREIENSNIDIEMSKEKINVDSLQLLISTKGKNNFTFLSKMFKNCNISDYSILIVDQSEKPKSRSSISKYKNIEYFNIPANGLSNSRNFAISRSSAKICLLCDDDVIYEKNFAELIINSFESNDLDVITYYAKTEDGNLFKNYPQIKSHNIKSISFVNTFLIAFRREKIIMNDIKFDSLFGLGSTFETGDEYIFLRNVINNNNLNIACCPEIILTHPSESSGQFAGRDKNIFARAAIFYKFYGTLAYFKLIHHIYLLKKKNMITIGQMLYKFKIGLKGIFRYKQLYLKEVK